MMLLSPPTPSAHAFFQRYAVVLSLALVTILSFCTYFYGFQEPQGFFWDENYHVASAQKYLNGVFFMEQHPPLGKLLIALGETLLNASETDSQFISTHYAKGNFTDGFQITGYRFFPAFLGWLTAPVLFAIFLLITRSPLQSIFLSCLYIFDNALIVHARGAMLDSTLLFFACTTILFFLFALESQESPRRLFWISLAFGASFALTSLAKLLGWSLILLLIALLIALRRDSRRTLQTLGLFCLGFTIVFIGVWQIHFSLAHTINPDLKDAGTYGVSETYQQILRDGKTSSPLSFPFMLRDALVYVARQNEGVPRLNLCNPKENGSPFFLWPLGARSINYRWTSGKAGTRYLYLQANPATWLFGLTGVLLALTYLAGSALFPSLQTWDPRKRFLIIVFLSLYLAYMVAVSRLDRVMYLYHYFLPLLFSQILFGCTITELRSFGPWILRKKHLSFLLAGSTFLVVLAFAFYSPLTYYRPLRNPEFQRRAIFPLWDLRCVKCARDSVLVVPIEEAQPAEKIDGE